MMRIDYRASSVSELIRFAFFRPVALIFSEGAAMDLTISPTLHSSTLDELQTLISSKFGIDKHDLAANKPLADYGLDSLALVELLFSIEDHFAIRIPEERANIDNLQQLAALVDDILKTQA